MKAKIVARAGSITRLVCHPRLPLVAGLAAERPAVHVWSCEDLRSLGTVGADSAVYKDDDYGRDRFFRSPAVAWHPDQPLLAATAENGVLRWTPDGLGELHRVVPSAYPYRSVAFSPDGERLWASPSSLGGEDTAWQRSDVISSGTIGTGPRWDTGVAVHPADGLVATLCSDQGATLCVFARPEHSMRVLRRALILDADGYAAPIFSADGRYLAIRGNAYENSLEVFEFPSLHRVLAMILGDPTPDFPYPDEWLEQKKSWARDNIAFGAPGKLWVGTPDGTLVEVDFANEHAVEHDLAGAAVTALCATPTGDLVVATAAGELLLTTGPANTQTADAALVQAFLDSTTEVPDDGNLEENLDVTDGNRNWTPDDRATVTTATDTDPPWLQLTAAINNARQQN